MNKCKNSIIINKLFHFFSKFSKLEQTVRELERALWLVNQTKYEAWKYDSRNVCFYFMFCFKARSNVWNVLIKYYQTLLDPACLTRLKSMIKYVGRSLTLFKLFIQHCPTFSLTWSLYKGPGPDTEIQHCSTIQHWSNTVQHHLTMLDNVGPICFSINLLTV